MSDYAHEHGVGGAVTAGSERRVRFVLIGTVGGTPRARLGDLPSLLLVAASIRWW